MDVFLTSYLEGEKSLPSRVSQAGDSGPDVAVTVNPYLPQIYVDPSLETNL